MSENESKTVIVAPDKAQALMPLGPLRARAEAIIVNDEWSDAECQELVRDIRAQIKTIRTPFDEHRATLYKGYEFARKLLSEIDRWGEDAAGIAWSKHLAYKTEQEVLAREREEKLRQEARRQEEDRLLALAAKAEAKGDHQRAEAIIAQPVESVVVHVEPSVAKIERLSERASWSAEVTDLRALIRWVADDVEHREQYLQAAMPALNMAARAAKRQDIGIPGIRAMTVTRPVSR